MCVSVCVYTLLHMNLQRTRFATIDHRFVYKNEANENKKGEGENQTIWIVYISILLLILAFAFAHSFGSLCYGFDIKTNT